ncbi:unnamed protein product [Ostreobium quekettii]|uniref:Uncharacterized protein n=1 Tax=Ostreobium quekettii TaxID=121088 RepID=A0A8S1IRK4_9CHLO|nr:unnamed protein product [Ostreobium quekettii]
MRKQALQIRSCNSSDRCETQKWHREAERAKVELSSADREEATISLGDEPRGCDVNLTRKEFNGLTELLVPRLWAPLKAVGETAHIEWSGRPACETHETATSDSVDATKSADPYAPPPRRVTQVVLAGGSSQLPVVKELMTKLTGIRTLRCPVHPKLCVATGAAIFAGMMEGSVGRIEIMDGSYAWEMHGRATGFQPSL